MTDDTTRRASAPISVDQLTEGIATGVLRALNSPAIAKDKTVDIAQLAADRGIFGQLVIICGFLPPGQTLPGTGSIIGGGIGNPGTPGVPQ